MADIVNEIDTHGSWHERVFNFSNEIEILEIVLSGVIVYHSVYIENPLNRHGFLASPPS
jgi:hypothetical protein